MGFWNPPQPGCPGQGCAQHGSAWRDAPLRRATGDAVISPIPSSVFGFPFAVFWLIFYRYSVGLGAEAVVPVIRPAGRAVIETRIFRLLLIWTQDVWRPLTEGPAILSRIDRAEWYHAARGCLGQGGAQGDDHLVLLGAMKRQL